jgi:hypothetical protein
VVEFNNKQICQAVCIDNSATFCQKLKRMSGKKNELFCGDTLNTLGRVDQ